MRRSLSTGFLGFVSAFLVFSVAVGNAQVQKQASTTPSVTPPMMQMPIAALLFIEDGDFTSNLVLVNGSAVPTYADVALRSLDGKTVATQRVQFAPYSQQQVSIRALRETGTEPNITNGSVTVMQSPSLSGMVIVAALSITQLSSSTPHYIDQELAMPSSSSSQMLHGVADSSDGSPLVAITSLSDMPQHVTIACLGSEQGETSKITLAPEQTILRPACGHDFSQGTDFHWYAENLPHASHQPVGIALTSDGMAGSFAAFGLAPHDSEEGRYFSSVAFTDPMMLQSTTTVFAGVPVGSSPLLPDGTYIPVLTLANFSQSARHVTVQYALTQNGSASAKTITTVNLAPLSTQQIILRRLNGDATLQDSFLVASDGNPGDVGAKLASKGDSPLHEVEFVGKDLADPDNGGDHPWTVANGTESTLLLFNNTAKPQWFNVEISAGSTVWRKAYQLQPMQTEAISINDLIKTGDKDDSGKVFPSDIWSGQVAWHMPAKNAGRGRILQSNRETAMARSFSCDYVAELCQVTYSGDTNTVPGGSMDAQMATQVCMNTCSGTPAGPGGDGYSYSWSSSDSSIASIPILEVTSQEVTINGVSAGSTYINGSASDGYCVQYMPAQSVTIQQPTYFFSPSASTVQGDCYSPSVGSFYDVSYYVADSTSTRINLSGMTPLENAPGTNGQYQSFALPSTTSSTGSFDDNPVGTCFTFAPGTPPGTQACQSTFDVTYENNVSGTAFGISTYTVRRDCALGQELQIQGNPSGQNKTYTQGTVN